jgi:hypothetical protein
MNNTAPETHIRAFHKGLPGGHQVAETFAEQDYTRHVKE